MSTQNNVHSFEKTTAQPGGAQPPSLTEKQRRELWLYIGVSIVAVELLVTVGAVFYGFMGAAAEAGRRAFAFPWLSWGALMGIAPALILLLVHSADVGLFRAPHGAASEREWQKMLPDRLQKLYRIIRGAPMLVVLLGIVTLGAALLTLDGAFFALARLGAALTPYIPFLTGGAVVIVCVMIVAAVWLNYRTRRLMAEYQFRRDVLEKTGVVIVDKGSAALFSGNGREAVFAIVAGEDALSRDVLAMKRLASASDAVQDGTIDAEASYAGSPGVRTHPPVLPPDRA